MNLHSRVFLEEMADLLCTKSLGHHFKLDVAGKSPQHVIKQGPLGRNGRFHHLLGPLQSQSPQPSPIVGYDAKTIQPPQLNCPRVAYLQGGPLGIGWHAPTKWARLGLMGLLKKLTESVGKQAMSQL